MLYMLVEFDMRVELEHIGWNSLFRSKLKYIEGQCMFILTLYFHGKSMSVETNCGQAGSMYF